MRTSRPPLRFTTKHLASNLLGIRNTLRGPLEWELVSERDLDCTQTYCIISMWIPPVRAPEAGILQPKYPCSAFECIPVPVLSVLQIRAGQCPPTINQVSWPMSEPSRWYKGIRFGGRPLEFLARFCPGVQILPLTNSKREPKSKHIDWSRAKIWKKKGGEKSS